MKHINEKGPQTRGQIKSKQDFYDHTITRKKWGEEEHTYIYYNLQKVYIWKQLVKRTPLRFYLRSDFCYKENREYYQ